MEDDVKPHSLLSSVVTSKLRANKEQAFSNQSEKGSGQKGSHVQRLAIEIKLVLEHSSVAFTYDAAGNKTGEVGRGLKCQAESKQSVQAAESGAWVCS